MWVGAGLTLPYYGAEDFGLHAAATEGSNLLAVADAVRYNPVAVTGFGVGLVTLAVRAVLVAVAVWRSGTVHRYAAVAFAGRFVLFLPQFFTRHLFASRTGCDAGRARVAGDRGRPNKSSSQGAA